MDISEFLLDDACTQILSLSDIQAKDIIVYYNSNNMILHSGVVQSVSSSGELTIRSKWGQAGVYQHSLGNIPKEYYADYSGGVIRYNIFRYHDYTNRYTGDEYHSGSQHYFRYADICEICNKETNESWISIDCMGPPCYVPWSLGTVVSRGKKTYKL